MNSTDVIPTTVEGIKRLAKKVKKEKGIPHVQALDQVAVQAGYQNYTHAKRSLEAQQPKSH